MTMPVIMRTGDVIDVSYIAASSALLIRSLVHYGNSNFILIYRADDCLCNSGVGCCPVYITCTGASRTSSLTLESGCSKGKQQWLQRVAR